MSLQQTPQSNRVHIAIYGKTNSGKSSLINALTGQETAVVSPIAGTTTDTVSKAMELQGIGATLFIDTPGFDDSGTLGDMRVERSIKAIDKTDIAILLLDVNDFSFEYETKWFASLKQRTIPTILAFSKADSINNRQECIEYVEKKFGTTPIFVSSNSKEGIDKIRETLIEKLPKDFGEQNITGSLVSDGDLILLVMPQDIQAPKGRLILPQVQTIRELLDKRCIVMSCTTDKISSTLSALAYPPKLIIADSQVFDEVYRLKPSESLLTSFSVLFAGYKGDIVFFTKSVRHIDNLTEQSKVLIAEACTHAPATEDIGRVKIPNMLRKRIGENITIDVVAGADFPKDLSEYNLIVHCGACMFNRKLVLSRVDMAKQQGIPMTNYGIAIAYLTGILDKIEL